MILNGKLISERLIEHMAQKMKNYDLNTFKFGIITSPEDKASTVYVRQKVKACEKIGITVEKIHINTLTQYFVRDFEISKCDACMVQMPLIGFPENIYIDKFTWRQDVDCQTIKNFGGVFELKNEEDLYDYKGYIPATALGIIVLLKKYNIDIYNRNVVIIGRSNTVGKPLFNLFNILNANTTLLHSKTSDYNIEKFIESSDILVSAVGKQNLICESNLNIKRLPKTIVDVGINVIGETETGKRKIVGDIDPDMSEMYKNDTEKYITPVPGGVGPMTVAMLMWNVCKCKDPIEFSYKNLFDLVI